MKESKINILPDFHDVHIVVVGDVMIDRYISGSIKRISPEAPVPVVDMKSVEQRPGGAANVALNLISLGAKVTLISVVGDDDEATILESLLKTSDRLTTHLIKLAHRKTTVKTRVMAGNQHVLRIDAEHTSDISVDESLGIYAVYTDVLEYGNVDGVILQDYNKGLLTAGLIPKLIQACEPKHIPTFVDPKEKNFFAYQGCTVFKPNNKEIHQALGNHTGDLDHLDKQLRNVLHHTITIITLGSQGIYLHDGQKGTYYKTTPRIIADVCGAGDAVISIVSLCYIKGLDYDKIALLANTAGGQVCTKSGVAFVDREELEQEINARC